MTEIDGAYEVLARAAAEAPDRPGRVFRLIAVS